MVLLLTHSQLAGKGKRKITKFAWKYQLWGGIHFLWQVTAGNHTEQTRDVTKFNFLEQFHCHTVLPNQSLEKSIFFPWSLFFSFFSIRSPHEKCWKENFERFRLSSGLQRGKILADNVTMGEARQKKQMQTPRGTKANWKWLRSDQDNTNPDPKPHSHSSVLFPSTRCRKQSTDNNYISIPSHFLFPSCFVVTGN